MSPSARTTSQRFRAADTDTPSLAAGWGKHRPRDSSSAPRNTQRREGLASHVSKAHGCEDPQGRDGAFCPCTEVSQGAPSGNPQESLAVRDTYAKRNRKVFRHNWGRLLTKCPVSPKGTPLPPTDLFGWASCWRKDARPLAIWGAAGTGLGPRRAPPRRTLARPRITGTSVASQTPNFRSKPHPTQRLNAVTNREKRSALLYPDQKERSHVPGQPGGRGGTGRTQRGGHSASDRASGGRGCRRAFRPGHTEQ